MASACIRVNTAGTLIPNIPVFVVENSVEANISGEVEAGSRACPEAAPSRDTQVAAVIARLPGVSLARGTGAGERQEGFAWPRRTPP